MGLAQDVQQLQADVVELQMDVDVIQAVAEALLVELLQCARDCRLLVGRPSPGPNLADEVVSNIGSDVALAIAQLRTRVSSKATAVSLRFRGGRP